MWRGFWHTDWAFPFQESFKVCTSLHLQGCLCCFMAPWSIVFVFVKEIFVLFWLFGNKVDSYPPDRESHCGADAFFSSLEAPSPCSTFSNLLEPDFVICKGARECVSVDKSRLKMGPRDKAGFPISSLWTGEPWSSCLAKPGMLSPDSPAVHYLAVRHTNPNNFRSPRRHIRNV